MQQQLIDQIGNLSDDDVVDIISHQCANIVDDQMDQFTHHEARIPVRRATGWSQEFLNIARWRNFITNEIYK
jgi:hypothetical protein